MHQDNLIAIEAQLIEIRPIMEGIALSLERGGTMFKAVLIYPASQSKMPDWRPGSFVRVAGICNVLDDDSRPVMGMWHPKSFQLLLRSPDDLTVIKVPTWWSTAHLILFLSVISGASLLASGIVLLIARYRLNEQARRRAMAEAEFAAILSERNRLACEIHDTLAQGLGAISMQLELAKNGSEAPSESVTQRLNIAHKLVRSSLAEARNSIWNMRSQVLENGDLVSALTGILQQLADGTGIEPRIEVAGTPRRLPPVIENNFLRIGQEAITNAVRHAHAHRVEVTLDFGTKQVGFLVRDDGQGFDVERPPKTDGGFGLVGMRERSAHMNAELSISSTPGKGTVVSLSVSA
jgi:signal transduction histidine kinase